MMINMIKTTHYEELVPKKNLTKEEFARLADVLQILIRTHQLFEFNKDISPEELKNDYLLFAKRSDFEGAVFKDKNGIQLYDLEDYQIHSAYFTEAGEIIITAYLKNDCQNIPFYAYPENLRYFKVSGEDTGFTTDELYYCFVTDVDVPVVEL